jgi:hypothetical protein
VGRGFSHDIGLAKKLRVCRTRKKKFHSVACISIDRRAAQPLLAVCTLRNLHRPEWCATQTFPRSLFCAACLAADVPILRLSRNVHDFAQALGGLPQFSVPSGLSFLYISAINSGSSAK